MDNMPKRYKCLFIKQPFADEFAKGRMSVYITPRRIDYRGEVLICAETGSGNQFGMYDGAWLARAEILDCIPVAQLTQAQIADSNIMGSGRKGYGVIIGKVRRLVEFPCHGRGFITKEIYEEDLVEYPTLVQLDRKGYEMILTGKWKRRR